MALTSKHPEWRDHKAQLEERREAARTELESLGTDNDRSNYLRGYIGCILDLIEEGERPGTEQKKPPRYT